MSTGRIAKNRNPSISLMSFLPEVTLASLSGIDCRNLYIILTFLISFDKTKHKKNNGGDDQDFKWHIEN